MKIKINRTKPIIWVVSTQLAKATLWDSVIKFKGFLKILVNQLFCRLISSPSESSLSLLSGFRPVPGPKAAR